MIIARTIIAVVVAASVALLPVAGNANAAMNQIDASAAMDMPASHDMSMSDDLSGCCPAGPAPCDWRTPGCVGMSVCAFVSLAARFSESAGLVAAPVAAHAVPFIASQILQSQIGDTPFRPPRV